MCIQGTFTGGPFRDRLTLVGQQVLIRVAVLC
jgi:hypothetical protein